MYQENLQNTLNIVDKMKSKGITTVSLGFSTGKDSLVGYDILKKEGINVIPIYFYNIPGLRIITENLKLYEDFYDIKITRLPHPMMNDYIECAMWQPLHRMKEWSYYYIDRKGGHMLFRDIIDWYFEKVGIECKYDANCMKMSDSINRRLLLRKRPDIYDKEKIIYIGKYLTDSDIWQYIYDNKLPLTKDYEIFGRSCDDVLNYQYLIGIKKYYQDDYELIKSYFPLIDLEILRYEAYLKRYEHEKEIN